MKNDSAQVRRTPPGGVATQRPGARSLPARAPVQITFQAAPGATKHLPFLRRHLRRLLDLLAIPGAHWHIRIVGDADMKRLHAQSLGLASTTDVLTFDLRDTPPKKDHEGALIELDTAICIDEARRRAAELRHPLEHELLLYCLHSLLHVQGYNDTTAGQFRRMHAREDELLGEAGIGAVYKAQNTKRKTQNKRQDPKHKRLQVNPSRSKIRNRKSKTRKGAAP